VAGFPARSCGVVDFRSRNADTFVTVAYRPKGYTYFVGYTRYDGWTVMMVDRQKDGTLLDGHGKPLPSGAPPVHLPFEMFKDTDYNAIDFGELISDEETEAVPKTTFDEVMKLLHQKAHTEGAALSASLNSTFMAPKRQRPFSKILITKMPTGLLPGRFGERMVNINSATPHLGTAVEEAVERIVVDFLEGRTSLNTMSCGDMLFVKLSDSVVDCTPNEEGKDSRFEVLHEYVGEYFLEDLAKRLMTNYLIKATIVEGKETGFLLSLDRPEESRWESF